MGAVTRNAGRLPAGRGGRALRAAQLGLANKYEPCRGQLAQAGATPSGLAPARSGGFGARVRGCYFAPVATLPTSLVDRGSACV